MGADAVQSQQPLQQAENGYWIALLDNNVLPPLFPQEKAQSDANLKEYAARRDAALFALPVPLFDEKRLEGVKLDIAAAATKLENGSALGFALGNNFALTANGMPSDADRSPLMLDIFRGWLETQYPSLEALNEQWGTKFVHWHQIVPPTTDAVKAAHQPAYKELYDRMLAPPPQPLPTPATPVLPKDARLDDPPAPPEPAWDIRENIKGFKLTPALLAQPGKENFSGWNDWRTFNDFVANRLLREFSSVARGNNIQAPLGLLNAPPPTAFTNADVAQLGRSVDWIESGDSSVLRELLRSIAPNVKRLTRIEPNDPAAVYRLWTNWLSGDTGVIAARETVQPANGPSELRDELHFISRTMEPLRQRVTRAVDPIAIYYSPRSIQLHWMLDSAADGSWWLHRSPNDDAKRNGGLLQLEAWRMLLDDLGYEPGYVQPEFLLSGQLRNSKIKVLILPKVLSLSDHEAVELRSWAKLGGVILADGACGVFDEHGKRRIAPNLNQWPVGILDTDFGIKRSGATLLEQNGAFLGTEKDQALLKDRVTGYSFGPSTSELRVIEPEVTEAGAYCHGTSKGGAGAMLSRSGGLGRFIYLNLAMQDYPQLRTKEFCEDFAFEGVSLNEYRKKYGLPTGGEALRLVIGDMLGEIALENPVLVLNAEGQPFRGIQRAHFDAGAGCRVVVLLPNGQIVRDGANVPSVAGRAISAPTPAWVSLPGDFHWYDVRTGKELGHGEQAMIQLLPDRATVLAALPYRAPRVRTTSRRTDPRGAFRVQAAVVSDAPAKGKHLFQAELVGPSGQAEPGKVAALTLAKDGQAVWEFALPQDAERGTHRLLIRDLLTGKCAEAYLEKE